MTRNIRFAAAVLLQFLACVVAAQQGANFPQTESGSATELSPILVTGKRPVAEQHEGATLDRSTLNRQTANTSDTARLLENIPGVSSYGAGGISSLPVVHGLADDRLRTQVDGMDLMTACPNHMNPALSFINPTKVDAVRVFAGITPVSLGGDSIGGTIQVNSESPKFARGDGEVLTSFQLGANYRSNGSARGANLKGVVALRDVNLSYADSYSEAGNYQAAEDFKKPGTWKLLGERPNSDKEVVGSEYRGSRNQEIGVAWKLLRSHLVELKLSRQQLDYEGFPNQRMDMVQSRQAPNDPTQYVLDKGQPANVNRTTSLHYLGQYEWGTLEGRYFHQDLRHHMDLLQERFMGMYMPMDTDATTDGGSLKATVELSEAHTLRVGSDFQFYRLNDWWPPIGSAGSSMCCRDYWNIRDGKRDRVGYFGEWEAQWNPQWLSLIGLRYDNVKSDVGAVQGYNNGWRFLGGVWTETGNTGLYYADAQAFNALEHRKEDHNFEFTVLGRFAPSPNQEYELGLARKSRSPNLYERYPWSATAMAALMNNFVGDGNGYIGNPQLKPEVAHTLSLSGNWHDAESKDWQMKTTAYVTHVHDFIDARRLNKPGSAGAACNGTNVTTTNCYVLLQYVNVDALLYGIDLSGSVKLGHMDGIGSFSGRGMASFVRGENRTTGDNLYHIMPPNAKLALEQRLGSWTNTIEIQPVMAKSKASQVRNEVHTPGYTLFNLRSSYEQAQFRLDLSIENALNRFYYLPLGGAYVAQGNSMTTNAIPWGMAVPGPARSFNVAITLSY